MEEPKASDSMTPPKKRVELVDTNSNNHENSIDDLFGQLVNINTNNIFHEPTCILCSNPHREEMEKKWVETKKYEDIKSLFRTRSSIPISNDVIDNHMKFHFERGAKELQKVEYINRLKRLNSTELTTLDRIRLGLSALTERLFGINSITPNSDLSVSEVEEIKSSETTKIMGAFNQLLKLQASILGEMKNNGELIIIPRQSFVEVFNRSIIEAKTDGEKRVIQKLLGSLAELNKKTQ